MNLLQPLRPAGNAQRKALARASEIQQLRAEGYSIEAIREALEAEGLKVSWSTVQREASRSGRALNVRPNRTPDQTNGDALLPGTPLPETQRGTPLNQDTRSPQVIAAEFMKGVNTNPLLQPKKGK